MVVQRSVDPITLGTLGYSLASFLNYGAPDWCVL